MLEIVTLAISLAANPFALAGYIGLGVYATSWFRALRYGFLWGLAVQIFDMALGQTNVLDFEALAVQTGLRLVGAVLITLAVHSLYGLLRGRGDAGPGGGPRGGPGSGPGGGPGMGPRGGPGMGPRGGRDDRGPADRRRSHLRRVK